MSKFTFLMNTKIRSFTFCFTACFAGISFLGQVAQGAVITVTTEQDLQSVINSASSNDQIKLLPGTYSGEYSLTDKNLTISQSGGTPTLTKFSLSGGRVTLIGLQIGQVLSSDSNNQAGNHLIHQCEIGNIESNTSSFTLQYSDVGSLIVNKKATVTACLFDGAGGGGVGITVRGSLGDAIIQNSIIRKYGAVIGSAISNECLGIWVTNGAKGIIRNNIVHGCKDLNYNGNEVNAGIGICINDNASGVVSGNIVWDCFIADKSSTNLPNDGSSALVKVTAQSLVLNNFLWPVVDSSISRTQLGLDVQSGWRIHNLIIGSNAVGTVSTNPKFVNWQDGDYRLASDSPAINAGPSDPQYNDRDGSRNDIGMFGGHNFIPDGRTTNKPIVLGLDIAPIAVPTGGTVTIESTGATVK